MVTIKVRSFEDIIRSYLIGFGYKDEDTDFSVGIIKEYLKKIAGSDENPVRVLDSLILKKARKSFPAYKDMEDEQMVAMFKLAFILSEGAKYYDFKGDLDESLIAKMADNIVVASPDYNFSDMLPQSIEATSPKKILSKIVSSIWRKK